MITPATAILTVLPGRVARCRSVMYPSCPLWWRPRGLLTEEQRGSAGPDLRARLAPSRVRRHLLDASGHHGPGTPPQRRGPTSRWKRVRPVGCDEGCDPAPPHNHWVPESCYVKSNSRDPLLHTRDDRYSLASSFDIEANPCRALLDNVVPEYGHPGRGGSPVNRHARLWSAADRERASCDHRPRRRSGPGWPSRARWLRGGHALGSLRWPPRRRPSKSASACCRSPRKSGAASLRRWI